MSWRLDSDLLDDYHHSHHFYDPTTEMETCSYDDDDAASILPMSHHNDSHHCNGTRRRMKTKSSSFVNYGASLSSCSCSLVKKRKDQNQIYEMNEMHLMHNQQFPPPPPPLPLPPQSISQFLPLHFTSKEFFSKMSSEESDESLNLSLRLPRTHSNEEEDPSSFSLDSRESSFHCQKSPTSWSTPIQQFLPSEECCTLAKIPFQSTNNSSFPQFTPVGFRQFIDEDPIDKLSQNNYGSKMYVDEGSIDSYYDEKREKHKYDIFYHNLDSNKKFDNLIDQSKPKSMSEELNDAWISVKNVRKREFKEVLKNKKFENNREIMRFEEEIYPMNFSPNRQIKKVLHSKNINNNDFFVKSSGTVKRRHQENPNESKDFHKNSFKRMRN